MEKRCKHCSEFKHVSEFGPHTSSKDGYQGICKSCNSVILEKARAKSVEVMTKKKLCFNCKKEKHVSQFYKNAQNKDGLQSWCIPCMKEYFASRSQTKKVTNPDFDNMSFAEIRDIITKQENEINELRKELSANKEPDCTGCRYFELGKIIEKLQVGKHVDTGKKYAVNSDGTIRFMS